ncbi:hypothetical protein V8B55DRAFT_1562080 [Mucor lusitanicus]
MAIIDISLPDTLTLLKTYYPQQASLASQEEILKNYGQPVENKNHNWKQKMMDLLKQTTHDKILQWNNKQLRRDVQEDIDLICVQLTKSHLETLQFQNENLTLRSSFNKLQNENAELPRSKADAYEEMRTFNNKHHDVLANQDSSTEREKIAPLLQTTTIATTSLREDHLELSSSLNQAYLETISEPKVPLRTIKRIS